MSSRQQPEKVIEPEVIRPARGQGTESQGRGMRWASRVRVQAPDGSPLPEEAVRRVRARFGVAALASFALAAALGYLAATTSHVLLAAMLLLGALLMALVGAFFGAVWRMLRRFLQGR